MKKMLRARIVSAFVLLCISSFAYSIGATLDVCNGIKGNAPRVPVFTTAYVDIYMLMNIQLYLFTL